MSGENVVSIVVKATDDTAAGFDEAKASSESAAGSMDEYAAATERVSKAEMELRDALIEQTDAQLRLAEIEQSDGGAAADVLAAAQDRVTQATLRAADAQIRLGEADARAAEAEKGLGDTSETSAAKQDESAEAAAGAGGKVKMALLGVAIGAGLAVKGAMDFQQSTTKLVTSAGESASQLGMLQRGILGISAQTATSASQLSSGLYMISSAGITGAGGLSVLKAAAEGAKSEGADLSEVTNALTSGINAYGMKTKTSAEATVSATSMMNQMLATVSAGKMTFQELASSLSAVLPIAAANKISYAQVGGALATMTSMGVSARQGTQDLASTIRSLANPTSVATNEMSEFGISSTDVSSKLGTRGLTGTIQFLSDAITSKMGKSGMVLVNSMNQSKAAAADAQTMLKQLPSSIQGISSAYLDGTTSYTTWYNATKGLPLQAKTMADQFATVAGKAHGFNQLLSSGAPAAQTYAAAMSKMLGGATGLNVGLMLTGAHAATFAKNVKSIGAAADGASGKVSGFAEVQKTTAFQLAQVKDSLQAAGISLGMVLLPAVSAILRPLGSFLSMIAQNKAASIALAAVVGGVLAGAIGTKAVHALKDMKSAMEDVAGGVEKLIGKLTGAKTATDAQAAASEEAAAATEEADAAAAASAEAEAAVVEESSSGMIASTAAWIAEHAVAAASFIAENVAMAASATAAFIAENAATLGLGVAIAALVAGIVYLATHWKQCWDGMKDAAMAVFRAVKAAVMDVVDFIRSHWMLLAGILLGPFGIAAALIVKYWHQIKDGAEDAFRAVEHAAEDAFRAVEHAVLAALDWIKGHWELLASILLGPLALAVYEIREHWRQISDGARDMVRDVTGFFSRLAAGVGHWFEHMWDGLFETEKSGIEHIISLVSGWYDDMITWVRRIETDVGHWFEHMWDTLFDTEKRGITNIVSKVRGWYDDMITWVHNIEVDVGRWFERMWDDLFDTEKRGVTNIVHWFETLPGKILSALSALPGMMFRAGKHVVESLIDGAMSMVGDLGSAMGSLASKAAGFFGLSPAKEGPLSGGGAPEVRGQHFAADLAKGMLSGLPSVASAARQVAGAAGTGPSGAGGYGAAGEGGGTITFRLGSGGSGLDQMFMTWLKNAVRSGGGDPRIFNKKVQFL